MCSERCVSDDKSWLKLRIAGEGGQEGKEDMTVIQEMITTLQVIFYSSSIMPLLPLFPVCEGGKPGDGEESLYDPVDQDGKVECTVKKFSILTLAMQEWNHWWFDRALPYCAPGLA